MKRPQTRQAEQAGIITHEEARLLLDLAAGRDAVLAVDEFTPEAYLGAHSLTATAATA